MPMESQERGLSELGRVGKKCYILTGVLWIEEVALWDGAVLHWGAGSASKINGTLIKKKKSIGNRKKIKQNSMSPGQKETKHSPYILTWCLHANQDTGAITFMMNLPSLTSWMLWISSECGSSPAWTTSTSFFLNSAFPLSLCISLIRLAWWESSCCLSLSPFRLCHSPFHRYQLSALKMWLFPTFIFDFSFSYSISLFLHFPIPFPSFSWSPGWDFSLRKPSFLCQVNALGLLKFPWKLKPRKPLQGIPPDRIICYSAKKKAQSTPV